MELVSLKSCLPSQSSQDLSGRSWTVPFDYQPNRMLLPKRLLRSDHRSFATLIQWTFLKLCTWHMNNHQPQGDTPGPQADYVLSYPRKCLNKRIFRLEWEFLIFFLSFFYIRIKINILHIFSQWYISDNN